MCDLGIIAHVAPGCRPEVPLAVSRKALGTLPTECRAFTHGPWQAFTQEAGRLSDPKDTWWLSGGDLVVI